MSCCNIRAIVSITDDWAIGRDGRLAVTNKADMRHFKETTMGGTLVMGRKTLDSLPGGRALPGRRNIVLTRDESFSREGVEVARGIGDVCRLVSADENVWIIGGESVYRAFLPLCSECLVTYHETGCPGADAWFPNLDDLPIWAMGPVRGGGVTEAGVPFEYRVYTQVI